MSPTEERARWFGPDDGLFGIVTPAAAGVPTRGVGLVLMNPGTLHRVGGARLNVRLARAAAAAGVPAIRFDFSGLGDSEVRREPAPYVESMVADLRAAMALLADETGVSRFALVGHCTGAAMSYEAALVDDRIVGIVQLEGFAYRTAGYRRHRWRRLLARRSTWLAIARGEKRILPFAARVARRLVGATADAERSGARDAESVEEARRRIRGLADLLPARDEMRGGLARLVARGVHMLHVYAGGDDHYYSYRTQFLDAFPGLDFEGLLELEHLPEADHYFSRPDHQRWLDARIMAWLGCLPPVDAPA
jgi:pimeloyl-ACP methyl ester carboxylesterase